MVVLNDIKNSNKTTIIVHGVDSNRQSRMEKDIKKAVKNVLEALNSGVVPGYGLMYMLMAEKVRQQSLHANGKEALAMEAAARAMEDMYGTLAANAGINPTDEIIAIKKAMADGNINIERNVPASQFLYMVKRAMESSIGMLRTDEVLSAKPLGSDGFGVGGSKVTIYTSEGCPWCARTKEYLKSKGISFKEVNVSKNPSAIQDMIRVSGQTGTPVTVIKGQAVVGFDRARLDSLL